MLTLLVASGSAAAAEAHSEPLVVVVESQDPGAVGAEAIRRAISDELGRPVVEPKEPAPSKPAELLIVQVGLDSVSLRLQTARDGGVRRRTEVIPRGADGLKTIGWLAGNLVRDQTSDLVAPARVPTVATAQPAPPPPSPPGDDDLGWRLGVTLGPGKMLYEPPQIPGSHIDGFIGTVHLELLTPRFRDRWTGWGGITYQMGTFTAAGLSAGISARWQLIPEWFAAELSAGAGFLVGTREFILFSPGGAVADSRTEGTAVFHALATLVFTRGYGVWEFAISVGANEWLNMPTNPGLFVIGGPRVFLP